MMTLLRDRLQRVDDICEQAVQLHINEFRLARSRLDLRNAEQRLKGIGDVVDFVDRFINRVLVRR